MAVVAPLTQARSDRQNLAEQEVWVPSLVELPVLSSHLADQAEWQAEVLYQHHHQREEVYRRIQSLPARSEEVVQKEIEVVIEVTRPPSRVPVRTHPSVEMVRQAQGDPVKVLKKVDQHHLS